MLLTESSTLLKVFATFADVTGCLGLSRDDMSPIPLIAARATDAQTPQPALGFPRGSQDSETHTTEQAFTEGAECGGRRPWRSRALLCPRAAFPERSPWTWNLPHQLRSTIQGLITLLPVSLLLFSLKAAPQSTGSDLSSGSVLWEQAKIERKLMSADPSSVPALWPWITPSHRILPLTNCKTAMLVLQENGGKKQEGIKPAVSQ